MIVVDASAALSGLLNAGAAREALANEQLHTPHLIDSEIAHALRRRVSTGNLTADDAWAALDTWRRLGLIRYPAVGLLDRVWRLRDNLSVYDATYVATYVALAERLKCTLVTADARLSGAPGLSYPIMVVPR